MSEKASFRPNSAKAIDDLLSLTERRQPPNWLLTYIDVFVLIVMLVVTLVSLSSFETPALAPYKPIKPVAEKPPLKQVKQVEATTEKTSKPEPVEKVEPVKPNLIDQTDEIDLLFEEELLAVIEEEDTTPLTVAPELETITPADSSRQEEEIIQQQLSEQLQQLGLGDSINMTVTQGYAQLEIQDNILYRSSEATLTETGQSVLTKLTPLLKQAQGLIYIEGHTDNRPISTPQFPSNWELGAARATSVLHFLVSQDIQVGRLRAVTYADTQPIADNDSEEGRQKNRRVNIVIKVSDKVN